MAAAIISAIARRRSVTSSHGSFSISRCNLFGESPSSYCYYDYQLLHFSTKNSPSNITPPHTLVYTEDFFVSKYQFSPQIASKLASASARMRNPQNPDLVLSFLKQTGFSNAHLDRIVRHHPNLLSSCPEKSVKPKLKIFQDLGLSAAEVIEIIARDFTILLRQPNTIIHSLDVYTRLLGSNDLVVKLIKKRSGMLYADPEKTLLPNIEFLKTCGVQLDQINIFIYIYPGLFLKSTQLIRRCVDKVDEMGVKRTSRLFIYAVRAVSDMSEKTLKLKLESFQDLGFSEDDILRLFSSAPQAMHLSTRKMKEVIELLLETGKYDMSCIIKNPTSFTRSVEKRYKPRLQVLKELERKGLMRKWPPLSTLCRLTDKSFFEKFVAPNINEVGEEFIAMMAASKKLETATTLKPI